MKFAAGFAQGAGTDPLKRAVYQLLNPEGSGKVLTVVLVEATCLADAYWTVRSWPEPLANEFTGICNQEFGAGGSAAKVYYEMRAGSALGNVHADFYRLAGRPLRIDNPPILTLNPGKGALFLCHTYMAGTVITIEWEECAAEPPA